MTPLPNQAAEQRDPADSVAVAAISDRLAQGVRQDRQLAALDAAIANLSQTDATPYEEGLTTLGKALGANAFKPAGAGRCDSAWLWDPAAWITFEAKSEEGASKPIPLFEPYATGRRTFGIADELPCPGASGVVIGAFMEPGPREIEQRRGSHAWRLLRCQLLGQRPPSCCSRPPKPP